MNLYLNLLPPLFALLVCRIAVAEGHPIGTQDVGEVARLVGPAGSVSNGEMVPRSQDMDNKSRLPCSCACSGRCE